MRENFLVKEIPDFNPISQYYDRLNYWREQKRRCIEGYWSSGYWMPGRLYFYINFWNIEVKKGKGGATLPFDRPSLRDAEWIKAYVAEEARGFSGFSEDNEYTCNDFYHPEVREKNEQREFIPRNNLKYIPPRDYLQMNHGVSKGKPLYENEARNVVELGARGYGKTFFSAGALVAHNFLFDGATDYDEYLDRIKRGAPLSSQTLVGAIHSSYSQNVLNKFQAGYDYLPGGTEYLDTYYPSPLSKFYKGSLQPSKYIIAHQDVKKGENWVRKGSKSTLYHKTFQDNPHAAAGTRPSIILIDEVGFMGNLTEALGPLKDCTEVGMEKFGTIWMTGTGGSMDSGATQEVQKVFENPEAYNCITFEDKWEGNGHIGMFFPVHYTLDKYRDSEGNVNFELAQEEIDETRSTLEKSSDPQALSNEMQNRPQKPSEAFLVTEGNDFPIHDAKARLSEIETNPKYFRNAHFKGYVLINTGGEAEWQEDRDAKIIREFPIENNKNKDGAIEVFQKPKTDAKGQIPSGRYVAGCLTPGEKVVTDKGIKKVEEVNLNDYLINKDGYQVPIRNLQRYYLEDESTYRIKVSNCLRTTNFTSEHPILVSDNQTKYINYQKSKRLGISQRYKDFNFEFKTVDQVNPGEWIKVPNTYYKAQNNFNINELWEEQDPNNRIDRRIESPLDEKEFWWFIGYWLGDGWCESNNYKITLAINKNETYYFNRLKTIISTLFNRKIYTVEKEGSYEISFSFSQLNYFLENHFGKYSYGKYIPEWVKKIDPEFKTALIQGYLDSDGSVSSSVTDFVSINYELLEGVQDILFSIGIISSVKKLRDSNYHFINGNLFPTKEAYSLSTSYYDTRLLHHLINDEEDPKLNKIDFSKRLRKKPQRNCIFGESLDYIYFQIDSIEESSYTGVVYNFECDTHTFMCKNITTHNCDPYDDDVSNTTSLGSIFVMDLFTERIVAEYTARPRTAEDYYENVYRLLKYYNATCNYENNLKGMFQYFRNRGAIHYLADTPEILKDMDMASASTTGNKAKGTAANESLNRYARQVYKSWLLAQAYNMDEGIQNVHTIRSEGLLKETIAWNEKGNFDRISAIGMLMILKEDRAPQVPKEKYKKIRDKQDDEFFRRNYDGKFHDTLRHNNLPPDAKERLFPFDT